MGRFIMRSLLHHVTNKYGKRGRKIFLGGMVMFFGFLFVLAAIATPGGNLTAVIFGIVLFIPGLLRLISGLKTPPITPTGQTYSPYLQRRVAS